ncbi:TetR/AcrR family transcriptional regulator [Streptomyces sparsus]
MTGLRERKKQQTRRHISDVATGLFLERGFEAVTIAEIAEAADVSVNTVYNYFPAKEDLFFDWEAETVGRFSAVVSDRLPGESAAEAVLRALRQDVTERSPHVGLVADYDRFTHCIHSSPTLVAKLWRMVQLSGEELTRTLAAEAGAQPGDPEPELVAGQLNLMRGIVFRAVGDGIADGRPVDEVAEEVLHRLDAYESLLSEKVLNYARRDARWDKQM